MLSRQSPDVVDTCFEEDDQFHELGFRVWRLVFVPICVAKGEPSSFASGHQWCLTLGRGREFLFRLLIH